MFDLSSIGSLGTALPCGQVWWGPAIAEVFGSLALWIAMVVTIAVLLSVADEQRGRDALWRSSPPATRRFVKRASREAPVEGV